MSQPPAPTNSPAPDSEWLEDLYIEAYLNGVDHEKNMEQWVKKVTAKLAEAPRPTDQKCYDCGNTLFAYDGRARCIYDGKHEALRSVAAGREEQQ